MAPLCTCSHHPSHITPHTHNTTHKQHPARQPNQPTHPPIHCPPPEMEPPTPVEQLDFSNITQQVWSEVRRAIKLSNQTESFWDNVQAFASAVDWTVGVSRWCCRRLHASSSCIQQLQLLPTNTSTPVHTTTGAMDQRHPSRAHCAVCVGAAVPAGRVGADRRVCTARWVQ